ncbi:MAG: hypothetical protein ACYC1K_00945 [Minisyncoccota bacterium]
MKRPIFPLTEEAIAHLPEKEQQAILDELERLSGAQASHTHEGTLAPITPAFPDFHFREGDVIEG